MDRLLERVLCGVAWGGALAGCVADPEPRRDPDEDAAPAEDAIGEMAEAGRPGPDRGEVGVSEPSARCEDDDGCLERFCFVPTGPGCVRADPEDSTTSDAVCESYPSNRTGCPAVGADCLSGPHFDVQTSPPDACCYEYRSEGLCGVEGRPLIVAGEQRVAAVVARRDWISPPRRG